MPGVTLSARRKRKIQFRRRLSAGRSQTDERARGRLPAGRVPEARTGDRLPEARHGVIPEHDQAVKVGHHRPRTVNRPGLGRHLGLATDRRPLEPD